MQKSKYYFWAGLALLILGIIAGAFGQLIVEDILGMERPFGEEPLSIKLARYGIGASALGAILMLYGGWRNKRGKK